MLLYFNCLISNLVILDMVALDHCWSRISTLVLLMIDIKILYVTECTLWCHLQILLIILLSTDWLLKKAQLVFSYPMAGHLTPW